MNTGETPIFDKLKELLTLESPLDRVTRTLCNSLKNIDRDIHASIDGWTDEGDLPPVLAIATFAPKKVVLPCLKLLVEHGANVNAPSAAGRTALVWTAARDLLDSAQFLIENGANVNAGEGSPSALHAAADWGNHRVAQLLLENGADVNAKDKDGHSPLHISSEREHGEIAQLLLQNGADVNARNNEGETPLIWAARHRSESTMNLLIEHGANVNAACAEGETALGWACRRSHLTCIKLLMENGADASLPDGNGDSPLEEALEEARKALNFFRLLGGKDDQLLNIKETIQ